MLSVVLSERIVLGSTSPRRRELLATVGFPFDVASPICDESVLPGEQPGDMVNRLAYEKAASLISRYPDAHIIGSDTTVSIDDRIMGKPSNVEEAREMLRLLSGREHSVWTSYCIVRARDGEVKAANHEARVSMREIEEDLLDAYIATGEPFDKAGAYAVQGKGSVFIRAIRGSFSAVVGLHVSDVVSALQEFGVLSVERRTPSR